MNDIQQYGSGSSGTTSRTGPLSPSRALSKQVARVNDSAMIRAVHLDIETRLTDAKIAAATALTQSAQQYVASLTAMEAELTKAVPLAGSRLEMIGNMAAIGIAGMVTDSIAATRRM